MQGMKIQKIDDAGIEKCRNGQCKEWTLQGMEIARIFFIFVLFRF